MSSISGPGPRSVCRTVSTTSVPRGPRMRLDGLVAGPALGGLAVDGEDDVAGADAASSAGEPRKGETIWTTPSRSVTVAPMPW